MGSKWTTAVTASTWIPRAATSVATIAWKRPREKPVRARCRWPWLLPPWIASACTPSCTSLRATLSAPWRVRQKTMLRPEAEMTSAVWRMRSSWPTAQNRCRASEGRSASSPDSW